MQERGKVKPWMPLEGVRDGLRDRLFAGWTPVPCRVDGLSEGEQCARKDTSGEPNRALEEQVERRLHFALSRFGDLIRQAAVQLADLNGPRGGEDQHCRIEVSLVPSGTIVAEATDAEIVLAVGLAADRIARRMRDALDADAL